MKQSMRNWHNWVSIVLGFPLLLVGITAFFIAHEHSLGTKKIETPLSMVQKDALEPRASAVYKGQQFIGTKAGLFAVTSGEASPVTNGVDDEIRDLLSTEQGLLVAGKEGIWRYTGSTETMKAEQVFEGDCWQIAQTSSGFNAACKDIGVLESVDGQSWVAQTLSFSPAATALVKNQGMPLSKVMMDIHTGKIFFGKDYEWIWIDLLGFACVGLGLTGLVMWMRNRRQKALV
ncbi:MAG: PepSY domain-containing protein [Marinagarivorans sp.]|nr:PepSY domain-containing protein [Marinagarivorans sp.]